MALPESITINNAVYATAELSEASLNQVLNIQIVDAEIARLQQLLAIAQAARHAYGSVLIEAVKTKSEDKPRKAAPRAKKA